MPAQENMFPESVFQRRSESNSIVPVQSQQRAVAYLNSILKDSYKLRVLIGSERSGKSSIVAQFIAGTRSDVAVAVVDGSDATAETLLSAILVKYGYQVDLRTADDLLRLLGLFMVQQTRAGQAPILVVENINDMRPAALRALCEIASFSDGGRFAARLVLTGKPKVLQLFDATGMQSISERLESVFEVEPLGREETTGYLHGQLVANGFMKPNSVLPENVCWCIHATSDGSPGTLNDIAHRTLEQALVLPACEGDVEKQEQMRRIEHAAPKLILTLNGDLVEERACDDRITTIGRSNFADIVLYTEFASKFHALLIRHPDALMLVDLNSANGTFVNSVRVSSTILQNNDIISLASYRLKVLDLPEHKPEAGSGSLQDTSKMKTLQDMRDQRKESSTYFDFQQKRKH